MDAVRVVVIGSFVGAFAAILMSIPLQWFLINGLEDPLGRITSFVLLVTYGMVVFG